MRTRVCLSILPPELHSVAHLLNEMIGVQITAVRDPLKTAGTKVGFNSAKERKSSEAAASSKRNKDILRLLFSLLQAMTRVSHSQ